jgi:hypothetical protein
MNSPAALLERVRLICALLVIVVSFAFIIGCALVPVDESGSAGWVTKRFTADHAPYRVGEILFSHQAHELIDCETCHFGTTDSERPTAVKLPPMALCFECHEGDTASDECITCHLENRKGRKPRFHDGQWPRLHKVMAEAESYKCQLCHLEKDCDSCHQVRRPLSHTPRWMRSSHGRMAVHARESCSTCHRSDFCENCHSQPPPDHTPMFMGFIEPGGAIRAGHRQAALIRGRACLTCHSYQDACQRCHG